MLRKFFAEALGTCLLVFFGVGTATLTFGFHARQPAISIAAGIVATALAFGLILLVLAYAIGPISGCHVNPAVTLGMLLTRRMSPREAGGFWIAQFAGGIIGSLLLWAVVAQIPGYSTSRQGLGINGWGVNSSVGISMGGAFLTEVVLTATFVWVILLVSSKVRSPATAGLTIGLALTVMHLIGISIDGTSVNPARSLGPALIVGGTALNQVWLFIVAPLVGAAVAAGLHYALNTDAAEAAAAQDARRQVPQPRGATQEVAEERPIRPGSAASPN